jgi:hypothetical protein
VRVNASRESARSRRGAFNITSRPTWR